ncbi:MAG: hypothetical protein R3350_00695, partial [Saprospiraceae bacterium]|nr:hypothetical protein [Saprospiraceae bacterium]
PALNNELLDSLLKRFYKLRDAMEKDPNTEKKASTSELIDWVKAVNHLNKEEVREMLDEDKLPHYQALLKTLTDYKLHAEKKPE